jgi:hypothetical protein
LRKAFIDAYAKIAESGQYALDPRESGSRQLEAFAKKVVNELRQELEDQAFELQQALNQIDHNPDCYTVIHSHCRAETGFWRCSALIPDYFGGSARDRCTKQIKCSCGLDDAKELVAVLIPDDQPKGD